MVTQQLLEYILEERKKGIQDDKIHSDLLKNNWSDQDITQAFSHLKQNIPAPSLIPHNPHTGINEDTRTIIVVLLLIFCYWVGLIFMWLWMKHWSKWLKILITFPVVLIIGLIAVSIFIAFINPLSHFQHSSSTKSKTTKAPISSAKEPAKLPLSLREQFVVIGGFVNYNPESIKAIGKTVEAYNPISNKWSMLPSTNFAYLNDGAATVSEGNKIYIFGSTTDGGFLATRAESYDAKNKIWQAISPPSTSQSTSHWNALPWGNKIIVTYSISEPPANGQSGANAYLPSTILSYDTIHDTYSKLASPNKVLNYCFSQEASIYCFIANDASTVMKYTPSTNTWESIDVENRQIVHGKILGFAPNAIYASVLNANDSPVLDQFNTEKASFEPAEIEVPHAPTSVASTMIGDNILFAGGEIFNKKWIYQKSAFAYDPRQGFVQLPNMNYLHDGALGATLPIDTNSTGGAITGKVQQSDDNLNKWVYVSLYKVTNQNADGSKSWKNIASENLSSDGSYSFYGLQDGDYEVTPGGAYTSFQSIPKDPNIVKIKNSQKVSNYNFIAH